MERDNLDDLIDELLKYGRQMNSHSDQEKWSAEQTKDRVRIAFRKAVKDIIAESVSVDA
tara:strand:- start:103 stop:279 length:177 start_codon:yes stop_codon:yes gene_type:complete